MGTEGARRVKMRHVRIVVELRGRKNTSEGQICSRFGGGRDLGGLVAQPDQKLAARD